MKAETQSLLAVLVQIRHRRCAFPLIRVPLSRYLEADERVAGGLCHRQILRLWLLCGTFLRQSSGQIESESAGSIVVATPAL